VNSEAYKPGMVTIGYTLLLVFTTGMCAVSAPLQSKTNPSIKGIVTNSVTGDRLRKAFLRLQPASGTGTVRPAVTDDDGRFVIENVEPGSYRIEAERQGFIEGQYGDVNGTALELRLAAGESLADLNVKLNPQAVISGRVVDEDGDVWIHAQIGVLRSVWKQGKRHLQGYSGAGVDDQGQFRIGQLPPGKYYVSAEPDAAWERKNRSAANQPVPRLQPTWYPSSHDVETATPIILAAGQEFSGLEIRLKRSIVHRIRGNVSGLQAIPPASNQGAYAKPRLSASLASGVAANSYFGSLRPDGSFEVQGLPSGVYGIKVVQGMMPSLVLGDAVVQVDDRDVENVSITVHPPRPVKGAIRIEGDETLQPLGLTVALNSLDPSTWLRPVVSQADGSFNFEQVASERYRVHVQGPSSDQFYLKLIRYGDTESRNGIISLSGPESTLELVLSTRGTRLTGTVKRSSAPQVVLIPNTLDAAQREHGTRLGVLDQNGVFTMNVIAPGAYTLFAFENVPEGSWTDSDFLKEIKSKGVEIQAGEAGTKTVEVPVILRSDIDGILSRLGID
jgi:hypothetical protein